MIPTQMARSADHSLLRSSVLQPLVVPLVVPLAAPRRVLEPRLCLHCSAEAHRHSSRLRRSEFYELPLHLVRILLTI